MVSSTATNYLSSPDAQVEEHSKVQAEPEDTKHSGTATNLLDEQDSSEIKGILRESYTRTGRHYNRISHFSACDAVSPWNNTGQPSTNGEHFNRASQFAAVEEKSNDPPHQAKKQASPAHRQESPQGGEPMGTSPSIK